MSKDGAGSIPVIEGGFVCLVDGQGEYNLNQDRLEELITFVDPEHTRDYSIVGIMGCQSTGKSTLLNRLFDTKFQMMNSAQGRSQTTKGIWLDAARNTNNLVVMDLEGTDSGERGEDRTTFERQTLLYGLALCEVLIVNMWEHDIGRYTASNYGVLKTVFEVNMQLFKNQSKTMLLFIVRDHVEEQTPFEALKAKLRREIEGIWAELPKPADFANSTIDDHFDFRFEWLPHLHLQRKEFEERCVELRDRFIDRKNPAYLLDTPYHGKKSVPADGFAQYSANIWDAIKSSKDLDLPTQKEMLATFRCDELVAQALQTMTAALIPVKEAAKQGPQPALGSPLGAAASTALNLYDVGASKYVPSVVVRKRDELVAKLAEPIAELVSEQITRHLLKDAESDFELALAAALASEDFDRANFFATADSLSASAVSSFNASVGALALGIPADFDAALNVAAHCAAAATAFAARVEAQRKAAIASVGEEVLAAFMSELQPRMTPLFRDPQQTLWAELGAAFSAVYAEAKTVANSLLPPLKASEAETAAVCKRLVEQAELQVREAATQHATIVSLKLRTRFENLFLKDAAGIRRRWGAKDDIQSLFVKARDETLQLVPLFATFRLREFCDASVAAALSKHGSAAASFHSRASAAAADSAVAEGAESGDVTVGVTAAAARRGSATQSIGAISRSVASLGSRLNTAAAATVLLISEQQQVEIEHQFKLDIESILFDAQREQERVAAVTKLPTWAYGVILFLGWNELMAVLRNPFVMVVVVMLGIAAFAVNALGMWGPVTAGLKLAAEQAYKQIVDLITPLDNATAAPAAAPAGAAAAPAAAASAGAGAVPASPGLSRRSTVNGPLGRPKGAQHYSTLPAAGFKAALASANVAASASAPLVREKLDLNALPAAPAAVPAAAAAVGGVAPITVNPAAADVEGGAFVSRSAVSSPAHSRISEAGEGEDDGDDVAASPLPVEAEAKATADAADADDVADSKDVQVHFDQEESGLRERN